VNLSIVPLGYFLEAQSKLNKCHDDEQTEHFRETKTNPWSSGKCVRFGAGRSIVRLSAGSSQDFVNWYCSLLIRRVRAAGNTPRSQKQEKQA